MSITGMYMLNSDVYDPEKIGQALEMLYIDRKNEFRELSHVLLSEKALKSMPNWKEFVLNFSLDVEDAFKTWSGQSPLVTGSPSKGIDSVKTAWS